MKHQLCSIALGALLIQPLEAVSLIESASEAQSLVSSNGYIIFSYAEGWERFSKRKASQLMSSRAIQQAAGNALYLPLPSYERPDEEKRRQLAEIKGELDIPSPTSYPAIIMLDQAGKHYATICGSELLNASDQEIAQLIATKISRKQQQQKLLTHASSGSATERAQLILKAQLIEEIAPLSKLCERLKIADPNDESKLQEIAKFSQSNYSEKLKSMSPEKIYSDASERVKDTRYSIAQRQKIAAAALGSIRRKSSPQHAQLITSLAAQMQQLNPNSPLGLSASHVAAEWPVEFSLESGWYPQIIPSDDSPIEITGPIPIQQEGNYEVSFHYTHGGNALHIQSVSLYNGEACIAQDEHPGRSGHPNSNHIYKFSLKHPIENARIIVQFKMDGVKKSYGKIIIQRQ